MITTYSQRFRDVGSVADYESKEYGEGSYASRIWRRQLPFVEQTVQEHCQKFPQARLLDFACGTGRVLSRIDGFAAEAVGLDISDAMVAVARGRCTKARLVVGDILQQPDLVEGRFDLITSFRFLLNVELELRQKVLRRLRELIRPDGLLMVNVHGNSRSLRHPAIVWRRRRARNRASDEMLNEMSPTETEDLLRQSGFRIIRRAGFGVLPPTLYRTPLRGLAEAVDGSLAGENVLCNWSIDMIYICQPN